jgi:flagellar basal-body rod protein FlgG
MDFAIDGNGFFALQGPNNEVVYSRDGSFRIGPTGRVESAEGFALLPELVIPPEAQHVAISRDGRISYTNPQGQSSEVGQVQLTLFANPSGLAQLGGNLYRASSGSGTPSPTNPGESGVGRLLQGFLEASNVSPVNEMTDMIRAQRVYELNSKVISTSDQMMQTLNQIK